MNEQQRKIRNYLRLLKRRAVAPAKKVPYACQGGPWHGQAIWLTWPKPVAADLAIGGRHGRYRARAGELTYWEVVDD